MIFIDYTSNTMKYQKSVSRIGTSAAGTSANTSTTEAPTTERNVDHDLLSASLILLDMYLITYTL